jgi:hypothetical protein
MAGHLMVSLDFRLAGPVGRRSEEGCTMTALLPDPLLPAPLIPASLLLLAAPLLAAPSPARRSHPARCSAATRRSPAPRSTMCRHVT